jgi:glycosyltransferase involved in cell wall biosynthesis
VELGERLLGSRFLSIGYSAPTEAHSMIAHSKVLVLPYVYSHASPSILYWAIHHLKPVIATRIDTLDEELQGYVPALLIRPRSSADISRAIRTLLTNSNILEESISFLQAKALDNTWERVAEAVLKSYNRQSNLPGDPQSAKLGLKG